MPLNPSSYSKIFKSKYVQDDDDDPVDVGSTPDVTDDDTPSYTPSVPAYSSPKVQELLSKPRPNFDKLFSSRYVDGGATPSFKPPEPSPRSYSSYQPAPRAMSEAPSSTKYSTNKDYDKIFTSKYLDEKPTFQKGVNPYIVEENSDDEEPVRHLPPSRSSSIRRAASLRRTYDESAPFTRSYEPRPLKNLVVSRSTTPIRSNYRSETPSLSYRSSKSTTPAPRRTYPQTSSSYDMDDLKDKEEAPVVFDANLTFVLGCKTPMKQYVKPIPAHQESDTQSSALSSKISDFLNRTDHVMQEWQNVGSKRKKREDTNLTGKSRSATNIMIKGFQLYSKANSVGRSSAGNSQYDDDTQDDVDEVDKTRE